MNIIGHKRVFLGISGIFFSAALFALFFWGLKLGIDFTGGSLLEIEYKEAAPSAEDVRRIMEPLALGNVSVQPTGERGIILRFRHADEPTHQGILKMLREARSESTFTEKRFDAIGPTIGQELKRRAVYALIIAVAAIILYISWAFRKVSRPVSSWKYGVVAIVALVHDVTIPSGIFAALGYFKGIEIDALFITALLTVMGFSVHDTIVVFDRIRENLAKIKIQKPFAETVNQSVKETFVRSVNTSLTVILVLAAVMVFGGETVKYFSLAMALGIIFGTYSSIFVASPLLVVWNNLTSKS